MRLKLAKFFVNNFTLGLLLLYVPVFLIAVFLIFYFVVLPNRKAASKRKSENNEIQEYKLKNNEIEHLSAFFISKDEKYISSLGNGYIMNYLANKTMSKGYAFITDKRVYFKGSCLNGTGKVLKKTNEERTVDVKNITGSGFTYHRYWGIIIAGILSCLIFEGAFPAAIYYIMNDLYYSLTPGYSHEMNGTLILAAMFLPCLFISSILVLKKYLFKRKTLFRIEYAGGCIAFNVSYYAKAEIDDFQKQLRRAKDLAEESASKVTVTESPMQPSTQNNVPDDLRKYADLLKEGLISQEEYDAMKKKILDL